MRNKLLLPLFVLFLTLGSAQNVAVGILVDKVSEESQALLTELKTEIKAVVGQDATIVFKEPSDNNFDLATAASNYQKLLSDDTDIILTFGTINTIMLYNEVVYPKPTIVFGTLSTDFISLPENKKHPASTTLLILLRRFPTQQI